MSDDDYGLQFALDRIRMRNRFAFFFTGLVFAILSFAIQFRVSSEALYIKSFETGSWVALSVTGLLALRMLGAFPATHERMSARGQLLMDALFIIGVAALLAAKILDSLKA